MRPITLFGSSNVMLWVQRVLASLVVAGIACLAWQKWWPFDTDPFGVGALEDPTVWQYLFADRYVLGVVRLTFVVLAVFVIVSVIAHVAAGRWLRFGIRRNGANPSDADENAKV